MGAFIVTKITSDNAARFVGLMPVEVMEEVNVGKCLAFGMLKKDGRKKFLTPVASLVYYLEPSNIYPAGILRVKWMYVHEKFRKKGVGDEMLEQICVLMRDNGITAATVDYYAGESEEAMTALLTKHGYAISENMLPECIIVQRDMDQEQVEKIARYSHRAKTLSSLSDKDAMDMIRRFLVKSEYRGFLLERSLPKDYFALSCSCYIGDPGHAVSLLLSHRTPTGRVRMEYIGTLSGGEQDIRHLLCTFATCVYRDCMPDTEIEIPVRSKELRFDLDKLFPNQLSGEIKEGVLIL
ncbi:MAG: GNAT family N-acetyltransferase [Lachnospiraceae bacterium]|nr:GNAT family N-acetyltransferase [Lachnospiraceae bacterium]